MVICLEKQKRKQSRTCKFHLFQFFFESTKIHTENHLQSYRKSHKIRLLFQVPYLYGQMNL